MAKVLSKYRWNEVNANEYHANKFLFLFRFGWRGAKTTKQLGAILKNAADRLAPRNPLTTFAPVPENKETNIYIATPFSYKLCML